MYSSIYRVQSSTRTPHSSSLWVYAQASRVLSPPSPQSLCVVVCSWCLPWVASLELKSNHLTRPSHTCSPSLIRKLHPDSGVKELHLHHFTFFNSQSLVPGPVAHLGLVISSYSLPYVLYTSPGLSLVSIGWLPFKRGSKPQGD